MSVFGPHTPRDQNDDRTIALTSDPNDPHVYNAPAPNRNDTAEAGFAGLSWENHLAIFGGFACFTISLFLIVKRLIRGPQASLRMSRYLSEAPIGELESELSIIGLQEEDPGTVTTISTSEIYRKVDNFPYVKYSEEGGHIHRVYFKEPSAANRAQERVEINQIYGVPEKAVNDNAPKKLPTLDEDFSADPKTRDPPISLAGLMTPRKSMMERESDVFVFCHNDDLYNELMKGSASSIL